MAKTKLTPADIEALVDHEQFVLSDTLTICVLTLTNGAKVTGESNCIDPTNFDIELGREYARKEAIDKLWGLEGYACKTRGFN
jgi:hypothetical protein